jgi:hypothetical protein
MLCNKMHEVSCSTRSKKNTTLQLQQLRKLWNCSSGNPRRKMPTAKLWIRKNSSTSEDTEGKCLAHTLRHTAQHPFMKQHIRQEIFFFRHADSLNHVYIWFLSPWAKLLYSSGIWLPELQNSNGLNKTPGAEYGVVWASKTQRNSKKKLQV